LLDLPGEVFHSIVFFIGECELKSALPENVMTQGICRYIQLIRPPEKDPEEELGSERKREETSHETEEAYDRVNHPNPEGSG